MWCCFYFCFSFYWPYPYVYVKCQIYTGFLNNKWKLSSLEKIEWIRAWSITISREKKQQKEEEEEEEEKSKTAIRNRKRENNCEDLLSFVHHITFPIVKKHLTFRSWLVARWCFIFIPILFSVFLLFDCDYLNYSG
jgi:hypothetical protein